ncbi:hypothetical protein BRARA_I01817 [Brassica rapa]|uniref:Uncharacterized protein n=1 Tax=Brassica campestris TaxID=3711 RepID=A0A397Y5B3_BRACM|nr:hypothetical protein BRARA_I01817 [Brassica rapa]
MARGFSQSQQSTSTASSTARPGLATPRGSAAATAGMRRCRLGGGGGASSGGGSVAGSGSSNMLRLYTDEALG